MGPALPVEYLRETAGAFCVELQRPKILKSATLRGGLLCLARRNGFGFAIRDVLVLPGFL